MISREQNKPAWNEVLNQHTKYTPLLNVQRSPQTTRQQRKVVNLVERDQIQPFTPGSAVLRYSRSSSQGNQEARVPELTVAST